jgi:hypothetical protein
MGVGDTREREAIVVPFSAPLERIPPVTRVRSTLLVSSIRSLAARNLFERYLTRLSPEHHETVRTLIAGTWLPIDLAMAHYEACDSIGLTASQQVEIGREVGAAIQGTFLGTIVRMARASGITPWALFAQYQKLWDRLLVGGGIEVVRDGPKEATLTYVNVPLVRVPYFRVAFRGVNLGACELFSSKVYATEVASSTTSTSLGIRLSWV